MSLIATPLGWIMRLCYNLLNNYGLALLLFTLITRLITLPLNIKQQKGTARMAMIQPEIDKIKKKYAKNQEKLQEETMKIYSKNNYNPMASCLPMIVTMVILFAMIPVIYGPLTYVSNLDKDEINESNSLITNLSIMSTEIKTKNTTIEQMLKQYEKDGEEDVYDKFIETVTDKKEYPKTAKALDTDSDKNAIVAAVEKHTDIDSFITNEKYVSQSLAQSRPELVTFDFIIKANGDYADILSDNVREVAEDFNYEIFGVSLGAIPTMKSKLAIIPFLSLILQLATTIVSQWFMKKNNPAAAQMGGAMKGMMLFMPLFSLWIAFKYPAGLGLYWIFSSLFALLQTFYLNIVYTPEKVQELVKKDMEKNKKKKKQGFFEKALEMQKQQEAANGKRVINVEANDVDDETDYDTDDDGEEKKLSKAELKEKQRKQLAEARRRMAEKYGDEYDDSEL